jgi:succinoglycan biosynthesis protein ExoA
MTSLTTDHNVTREFISLIIPTFNEALHIKRVVEQVCPAEYDYEIIVVDGGSTDGTLDVIKALGNERVRVINNPRKIQSAGVNLAVSASDPRSRFFVRIDAHCTYPAGWVDAVIGHLKNTGATSVVVTMDTQADDVSNETQVAIACAQNSMLGNGGSVHRNKSAESRYVDHGHHAGFLKEFFLSNGGYDDSFSVNEDAEYDQRTSMNGAKVWLAVDCGIVYHPRNTFVKLATQYFRYGYGRCATILKHRSKPKVRQMLPVCVALSAICALVLQAWSYVFLAPFLFYLLSVFALSIAQFGYRMHRLFPLRVGAAIVAMHLMWGFGFLIHASASPFRKAFK